jgi:glycerol-3-phosphate dehydrogenase (NAD(P)+)
MSFKISIIGGGGWGTALAYILAEKGYPVYQWVYEPDLVNVLNRTRENTLYLPGIKLSDGITATSSFEEVASETKLILFAVPSHVARSVLIKLSPLIQEGTPFLIATKGIENETLMLMSQVVEDILPSSYHPHLAVLSGPSFAREVCAYHPTAVVLAANNRVLAARLQEILTTSSFKVFTSNDPTGVQIGGALKNVTALAAGGADGLGYGRNTRAALITRGLMEMMHLGKAMGADPITFSGLSGLGDLILTCTSELSRNRTVGYQLGQGLRLKDILGQMKMVAEGVETTRAAYRLARQYGVRMPIVEQVYAVLFEEKNPRQAVTDLMQGIAGNETET